MNVFMHETQTDLWLWGSPLIQKYEKLYLSIC